MRLAVAGAGDDLVELRVPEDADERAARRDWRDEFGAECCGVEDVKMAGGGASEDICRGWREYDVAGWILGGRRTSFLAGLHN